MLHCCLLLIALWWCDGTFLPDFASSLPPSSSSSSSFSRLNQMLCLPLLLRVETEHRQLMPVSVPYEKKKAFFTIRSIALQKCVCSEIIEWKNEWMSGSMITCWLWKRFFESVSPDPWLFILLRSFIWRCSCLWLICPSSLELLS